MQLKEKYEKYKEELEIFRVSLRVIYDLECRLDESEQQATLTLIDKFGNRLINVMVAPIHMGFTIVSVKENRNFTRNSQINSIKDFKVLLENNLELFGENKYMENTVE